LLGIEKPQQRITIWALERVGYLNTKHSTERKIAMAERLKRLINCGAGENPLLRRRRPDGHWRI
jgi:hypothetical protein